MSDLAGAPHRRKSRDLYIPTVSRAFYRLARIWQSGASFSHQKNMSSGRLHEIFFLQ